VDAHLLAHRLWQLSPAFELSVVARLFFSGLLSRYKWLALLLGYDCAKTIVLSNLRFASSLEYSRWYVISHVPLWILECAVVVELFSMVAAAYPRIGSTKTVLFRVCATLGLTMGVIIALGTENPRFPAWLTAGLGVEKAVDVACMLLICFQALFFFLIRVPMRANLVRHRAVLTVWWLASGVSLVLLLPYFARYGDLRNITFFAITNACYFAWTLLLRTNGETEPDRGSPLNEREIDTAMHAYGVSQTVQRQLRRLGSKQGNAF
jgi:hypothetical protein